MALGTALLAALAAVAAAAPAPIPGPPAAEPARTYEACQAPTRPDPLAGCPPGTLYVSGAATHAGAGAHFSSIQAAIASLPHDASPATILIAPGLYREQLNVTRPGPLTLLGTRRPGPAAAYGSAASSDASHANPVSVVWAAANADNTGKIADNAFTAVLTVAPTWNASLTGTGPTGFPVPWSATPPGSADFRAYNVDFRNLAAERSVGPALAVTVARARAGFYGCGFYSYQDTVFVGKRGAAFFYDSVVAGEVDFLYGFGTAWVERSLLALRGCGGGIAAWKGTNTTQPNHYGLYVSRSRVQAANTTIAGAIAGTCPLGRPWNALHRSVYLSTYLDGSVLPAGYVRWAEGDARVGPETLMAVADSAYGPGYDAAAVEAAGVGRVLDGAAAGAYATPASVFRGPGYDVADDDDEPADGSEAEPDVSWIDQSVYPRE